MEFWILRFDTYPNALQWLDQNHGVAVTEHMRLEGFNTRSTIIISKHIIDRDRAKLLEPFPLAHQTKLTLTKDDNIEHPSYSVAGTGAEVINKLKALGGIAKNAPCYLGDISLEDCAERIQELQTRSNKSLSQLSHTELGNLYRSIYP